MSLIYFLLKANHALVLKAHAVNDCVNNNYLYGQHHFLLNLTSFFYSSVSVFKSDDVVLAQIAARLNLDDFQRDRPGVSKAMNFT